MSSARTKIAVQDMENVTHRQGVDRPITIFSMISLDAPEPVEDLGGTGFVERSCGRSPSEDCAVKAPAIERKTTGETCLLRSGIQKDFVEGQQ